MRNAYGTLAGIPDVKKLSGSLVLDASTLLKLILKK
jgi:hypothetical protein